MIRTSIYPLVLALVLSSHVSFGQAGVSLYHLNNATFQGNHFNPAFMPEGKVFLGLPVLSGIAIDLNSRISYEKLVKTNESGVREYNIKGMVDQAAKRNYLSIEGEVSLLHLGFRKKNHAISFFIRERFAARVFYGKELLQLAWYGNERFQNQSVDLSRTAADARHYREYGIGLWKYIPDYAMSIGVRVKYLNGMFSAVTDPRLKAQLSFTPDNPMGARLSHAVLNTSGVNVLTSGGQLVSHLIHNGNYGLGIDLGVQWKINDQFSAAVALNDLGFIAWRVDPKNYLVKDVNLKFTGLDNLRNIGNMRTNWVGKFKEAFKDTTDRRTYTTGLNTTAYGSLMYQLDQKSHLSGTIATHIVKGNFRTIYSVGYTRKVGRALDVAANVSRIPQQGIDVGLAAAVTLGAFQIYLASDKLLRIYDLPKVDAFDFWFGINFIFGRPTSSSLDKKQMAQIGCPYIEKRKPKGNYKEKKLRRISR